MMSLIVNERMKRQSETAQGITKTTKKSTKESPKTLYFLTEILITKSQCNYLLVYSVFPQRKRRTINML